LGKIDDQILEVLQKAGKPLTLTEIAEQADKPPKKIFSGLRKLFEAGKVDCDHKAHTYTLAREQKP
jgi:DNA-binding IclR family transcriptional regulator